MSKTEGASPKKGMFAFARKLSLSRKEPKSRFVEMFGDNYRMNQNQNQADATATTDVADIAPEADEQSPAPSRGSRVTETKGTGLAEKEAPVEDGVIPTGASEEEKEEKLGDAENDIDHGEP